MEKQGNKTWVDKIVDTVLAGASLLLRLPFLPVAALIIGVQETLGWIGLRWSLGHYRRETMRNRYELQQNSRLAVNFLDTFLTRQEQLWRTYYSGPWTSLEEARNAYQLTLLAEAVLLREAQVTARAILQRQGNSPTALEDLDRYIHEAFSTRQQLIPQPG